MRVMRRLVILIVLLTLCSQPALAQGEVTMTVSVTNPAGEPVQGAELTASWEDGSVTRTTASNGKAFIDVPAGADVSIEVAHENYVRNAPQTVDNVQGGDVTVNVYPKASATITVDDGSEAVGDAHVVARKNGVVAASGTTGTNGVFDTGVVEQGTYAVTVTKPGYYEKTVEVDIRNHVERNVSIEEGTVSVSFNVTDDHFADPKSVGGAAVHIGDIATLKTQDNGRVAMNLPVNTKFDVEVTKPGYDAARSELTVGESAMETSFTLQRSPNISIDTINQKVVVGQRSRVEITNAYGEPVEGATVYLDGEAAAETDANGVVTVPIETEGNHTVYAAKDGLESERMTVQAFSTASEKQQGQADQQSESRSGGITGIGMQILETVVDAILKRLG